MNQAVAEDMSSVEVGAFYPGRRPVPAAQGVPLDLIQGGASVAQPQILPRAEPRVEPHVRSRAEAKVFDLAFVGKLAVTFLVTMFCAFLTTGIMANLVLEQARIETTNYTSQARASEATSRMLAAQVRALESPERLSRMAAQMGIGASDTASRPSE